jgi:hypothetical protein
MLKLLDTFGHSGHSLEQVRASLGLARPVTVRHLAEVLTGDVVFDEALVTDDGIALGGHHTLTLGHDGSYRYQGRLRATGFPSFDVAIVTTLGYSIDVPDSAERAAAQIAFAAHGRVHGTNEPGEREFRWDQQGVQPLLRAEWHAVRVGRLSSKLQFDTDWFGPAGNIASFLAQIVAMGATFGAAGVAIVLVGEAADLLDIEQLVLPGFVGVLASAGAGFVFGPGLMIPAFIVGAAVTVATVKQRHLSASEAAFADVVFMGKVPFDRVLLTNLVGLGGRPFTAPGPGGVILVNLGRGYDDPVRYTGKGGEKLGQNAPGQLLIHELTHAWQIANSSFTPEYYCRAVSTAVGTLDGNMSAYTYGSADGDWEAFGTEQQASIVDEWFAGNKNPGRSRQSQYVPMESREAGVDGNPYFRYIRDNIRTGIG